MKVHKAKKSKEKKFTFNTRVALGSQKNQQRNMPITLSEAPWENKEAARLKAKAKREAANQAKKENTNDT